jgi:hypothetical protein
MKIPVYQLQLAQGFGGETWRTDRAYLEDKDLVVRIILQYVVNKYDGTAWNGFIWFRIEESGGLLCKRLWTFGFHKSGEFLD